jgi:hypothetical protein
MAVDPWSLFYLKAARVAAASGVELLPDPVSDVDLSEELLK